MTFIILRLQRIGMTPLFSQTKYCTMSGTSNNSSILEIAKEPWGMKAGLKKTANNFSYREGRKNVGIRDSVIRGKGFAKTKI